MKKDKKIDPVMDKFLIGFTYAQAEALAVVFREGGVDPERWKELAGLFAKTFNTSLKEAVREKNGEIQKGEG